MFHTSCFMFHVSFLDLKLFQIRKLLMRRSIGIIGCIEKFDKRLSVQHLHIQTHTAQPGGNRIEALIEHMPSPRKCVLAQADFSCRTEHFFYLMEKSPLTVTQRV